ncbi:hypothetical protein [Burkholderia lata]|uniref:hypothetical protein n=1 Tax=Burkholderia lata (strain ATCC 17760 / DSM 23089 / LMG 22485 / NCIMB 9086 / R18194 / 383) TaxID=482957 RepID=UPI001581B3D4|nr:hypothetical protein [Burkholderia lata]
MVLQPNSNLQSYILENCGSALNGVPNIVYGQAGKSSSGSNLTGPLTKFDPSDAKYVRNTTADAASAVSSNAGRLGATAATGAVLPTPLAPAFEFIAFGSTVAGWAADFVAQMARPNLGAYVVGGVVDVTLGGAANKYPLAGIFFTELGNGIKSTGTFNDVGAKLNEAVRNRK